MKLSSDSLRASKEHVNYIGLIIIFESLYTFGAPPALIYEVDLCIFKQKSEYIKPPPPQKRCDAKSIIKLSKSGINLVFLHIDSLPLKDKVN